KGSKMSYNFNTKTGNITDAIFYSDPYFGKTKIMERVSEEELVGKEGYVTSCSYDQPHYRIRSKKINVFPGDKIQTRSDIFYLNRIPLLYLSRYNHSLKDPLLHVQISPGKSKKWGAYVLSAWRYNITDDVTGRIYLDYRARMGIAYGFGANYKTKELGRGDLKYYYTQERPGGFEEDQPGEFQRYFVRWRHKWSIDDMTTLTSEYFKIVDSKRILMGTEYNVLKDYFPREYELDSTPLSYTTLHRNFNQSSLDVILQKRVNRWYSQLEKLPEASYSLPSLQIGESPFYFSDATTSGLYNYKFAVPSDSWNDVSLFRTDTTNKFSMPLKVSFITVTPNVGVRNTFYDSSLSGGSMFSHPRTVFLSGADASTKFYRLFNVKSDFLGMDINDLRHVITPTVGYNYAHEPTEPASKLKQIDGVDGISSSSNAATLELSNKLQTKRKGMRVDLADFRVTSTYTFNPEKSPGTHGSSLSDILFDLELKPYSWLNINSDATYDHYSDYVSSANYDFGFNLAPERGISFGHRYQRKGSNQLTFGLDWKLNPKWKLRMYERYEIQNSGSYYKKNGFREQEYVLSRDLHCWIMEINYNVRRGEGASIWFIFRLKAFPEVEFNYNKSYNAPKAGSQSS
ncbi:MAG: LPS assembly protein LptD, partial [Candidatus Omnitrophota bacterium]